MNTKINNDYRLQDGLWRCCNMLNDRLNNGKIEKAVKGL